MVHPDDLPQVIQEINAHLDGRAEVYEAEYRLRCDSGGYKWVLSRGRTIEWDHSGRPSRMVGTTVDVSRARELTEQLKVLHNKEIQTTERLIALSKELAGRTDGLATAHRIASIGIWRWDLQGRYLELAPESWRLMGFEEPENRLTYARMRKTIHPDDYFNAMDQFYRTIQTKTPVVVEYRIIKPDGAIHHVLTHAEPVIEPDGSVLQVQGTTQDITPYHKIEEALRESEDHYRHMVELHPQIPWLADPNGNIVEVGPQWFAMTGMTLQESLPSGWIGAVFPDDQPSLIAAWESSCSTGNNFDFEYRLRRVDGSYCWVRARACPRFGHDGEIIRWYGTLEDVNDKWVAEAARRASDAIASSVLEATSDAVVVCDHKYLIKFTNGQAARQLGADNSLPGKNVFDLFSQREWGLIKNTIERKFDSKNNDRIELFCPNTELWLEIRFYINSEHIYLFIRNITENHFARQKLEYAANHDLMTGALTRSALESILNEKLRESRPGELTALLYMDLDYFKEINDKFGHSVGDSLLVQIVNRIKPCLRSQDQLARGGGDEFIIMQTGLRKPPDAVVLANRIIAAVRAPVEIEGHILGCGASLGIAVSTPGCTAKTLLQQADLALYEAKRTGRGRYHVFKHSLQDQFEAQRSLRGDLLTALPQGQFKLVFQPIIESQSRRIVGAEALLRWAHPQFGLIPPTEFIPMAESNGQIGAIGAWVLRTACEMASEWPDDIVVSVNVSPRQIDDHVLELISDILYSTGFPARRLKLEVTESILIRRSAENISKLHELRDLGVRLVLDDFGTGYSSLSYLNMFKFDFIKIDKSFIDDITSDDGKKPVLEAIVRLMDALDMPVTAEGVETEEQFDYVRNLGCAYAQGYLFGKPMPEIAIRQLLEQQNQVTDAH